MARARKLPAGLWKRGNAYYARFRAGGRLVRKRLSTEYVVAVQLLNDLRARADKADFDVLDNDCPWADLKAEFLRWARQAVRRPGEYEADLDRFESYSHIRSARQITPAVMMGYREWRLSQNVKRQRPREAGPRMVSPRTVNREVGTLNNLLNKAVQWRRIGSNPIKDLKPLRHDALVKERRPLTMVEVDDLFAASSIHMRPVWRMFMCTAIRRSELVNLRFDDIDFERKSITVRAATAKNHKAREIPLDDTMLEMLVELQEQAKDRCPIEGTTPAQTAKQASRFSREQVFVTKANTPLRNNLLRRFYATCKLAGIDDGGRCGSVDIQSLRVTCATLMLQNGANPKDVQAILGHSTLTLTMKVYARATESGKRSAISALPFAFASVPDHIISVQKAHKSDTANSIGSKRQLA